MKINDPESVGFSVFVPPPSPTAVKVCDELQQEGHKTKSKMDDDPHHQHTLTVTKN